MNIMMKRTSLLFDDRDMKALGRIAEVETQLNGTRVSASAIVRRVVRQFLRTQTAKRQGGA